MWVIKRCDAFDMGDDSEDDRSTHPVEECHNIVARACAVEAENGGRARRSNHSYSI